MSTSLIGHLTHMEASILLLVGSEEALCSVKAAERAHDVSKIRISVFRGIVNIVPKLRRKKNAWTSSAIFLRHENYFRDCESMNH